MGFVRKGSRGAWFCPDKPIGDKARMVTIQKQLIASSLHKVLQRLHYPLEVILTCVRCGTRRTR